MSKKQWQGPKLIVLVRGQPEEACLQGTCKSIATSHEGPYFYQSYCATPQTACAAGCSGRSSSS